MTEHRWTVERATRRHVTVLGERFDYPLLRFVCSCGAHTDWCRDPHRAEAQRNGHALDGQRELAL